MLNILSCNCAKFSSSSLLTSISPNNTNSSSPTHNIVGSNFPFSVITKQQKIERHQHDISYPRCHARRRVRYDDDNEQDDDDDEYGHNAEIAMLEMYSQAAMEEVLLVKAIVDGHEAEVLVFKGFSSSLSYETSPDPTRSILPARAVIKSIDRIKGPFDPSNIQYIEKDLAWEAFKTRLLPI